MQATPESTLLPSTPKPRSHSLLVQLPRKLNEEGSSDEHGVPVVSLLHPRLVAELNNLFEHRLFRSTFMLAAAYLTSFILHVSIATYNCYP